MYQFHTQLAIGEENESKLDVYFADKFVIEKVSLEEQKNGIDRIFTSKQSGRKYKVEYKSDIKASKTGNAFIETMSADRPRKLGWALTSQAEILIYFLPNDLIAYVVSMPKVRELIPQWEKKYKKKKVRNVGYNAYGMAIPLWEMELIAAQIIYI